MGQTHTTESETDGNDSIKIRQSSSGLFGIFGSGKKNNYLDSTDSEISIKESKKHSRSNSRRQKEREKRSCRDPKKGKKPQSCAEQTSSHSKCCGAQTDSFNSKQSEHCSNTNKEFGDHVGKTNSNIPKKFESSSRQNYIDSSGQSAASQTSEEFGNRSPGQTNLHTPKLSPQGKASTNPVAQKTSQNSKINPESQKSKQNLNTNSKQIKTIEQSSSNTSKHVRTIEPTYCQKLGESNKHYPTQKELEENRLFRNCSCKKDKIEGTESGIVVNLVGEENKGIKSKLSEKELGDNKSNVLVLQQHQTLLEIDNKQGILSQEKIKSFEKLYLNHAFKSDDDYPEKDNCSACNKGRKIDSLKKHCNKIDSIKTCEDCGGRKFGCETKTEVAKEESSLRKRINQHCCNKNNKNHTDLIPTKEISSNNNKKSNCAGDNLVGIKEGDKRNKEDRDTPKTNSTCSKCGLSKKSDKSIENSSSRESCNCCGYLDFNAESGKNSECRSFRKDCTRKRRTATETSATTIDSDVMNDCPRYSREPPEKEQNVCGFSQHNIKPRCKNTRSQNRQESSSKIQKVHNSDSTSHSKSDKLKKYPPASRAALDQKEIPNGLSIPLPPPPPLNKCSKFELSAGKKSQENMYGRKLNYNPCDDCEDCDDGCAGFEHCSQQRRCCQCCDNTKNCDSRNFQSCRKNYQNCDTRNFNTRKYSEPTRIAPQNFEQRPQNFERSPSFDRERAQNFAPSPNCEPVRVAPSPDFEHRFEQHRRASCEPQPRNASPSFEQRLQNNCEPRRVNYDRKYETGNYAQNCDSRLSSPPNCEMVNQNQRSYTPNFDSRNYEMRKFDPRNYSPKRNLSEDQLSASSIGGKSDFLTLAYQRTGDYPELVDELENTLSQRNRIRVQKTMEQFEILSRQNKNLDKPIFDDEESLRNHESDNNCQCGYCSNSKTDSHSHSVTKRSSMQFTKKPGYVEKVAKFMDPNLNRKSGKFLNAHIFKGGQIQHRANGTWQMDTRKGEWVKVADGGYDFENSYPPLPPRPRSERQDFSNRASEVTNNRPCSCSKCNRRR